MSETEAVAAPPDQPVRSHRRQPPRAESAPQQQPPSQGGSGALPAPAKADPPPAAFAAGDVVQFRSGGPRMTVQSASGDGVALVWLSVQGLLGQANVRAAALKPCSEGDGRDPKRTAAPREA
jgi:uncharacterized protein YodC (DUF2158 family)